MGISDSRPPTIRCSLKARFDPETGLLTRVTALWPHEQSTGERLTPGRWCDSAELRTLRLRAAELDTLGSLPRFFPWGGDQPICPTSCFYRALKFGIQTDVSSEALPNRNIRVTELLRSGIVNLLAVLCDYNLDHGITDERGERIAPELVVRNYTNNRAYKMSHFGNDPATALWPGRRLTSLHLSHNVAYGNLRIYELVLGASCGAQVRFTGVGEDPSVGGLTLSRLDQFVGMLERAFPNSWQPLPLPWRPDRHAKAPDAVRRAVRALTLIRSLCPESVVSPLPNELLFLIFERL